MIILYNVIECFVSFVETYVCYLFLNLFFENRLKQKIKSTMVLLCSLAITVCIFFNNQISLFSNFLLLFVIIIISISTKFLFKTGFVRGITFVGVYYLGITILDLFAIFIISIFTGEEYVGAFLLEGPGLYRSIFICTMKLILVLFYNFLRNKKINYKFLIKYWPVWLTFCMIGYSALFYFQQFAIRGITDLLAVNWLLFLVILIMFLLLFYMYMNYRDFKEKSAIINVRNDVLEKSYAHIQKLYKDNGHVLHDFKNHIAVITNYIKKSENEKALKYIENIIQPIHRIESTIWSGIEIVDIILNCKMAEAEANHIKMDMDILIAPSKITDADFCTILSNLLDNAIESAIKDSEEKRYIKFTMKSIDSMLLIKVKNNMIEAPKLSDSLKPETTKKDEKGHGIGLESVEFCVNKYGGNMKFELGKDYFKVQVFLLSV